MLEADMADTLAGFVAARLGVPAATDPRPRVWAALVMATFRIALHLCSTTARRGGCAKPWTTPWPPPPRLPTSSSARHPTSA